MSFAITGAIVAGGVGLLGGAAVGAAGLAGAGVSALGGLAAGATGLGVSAASGLVSGVGGLASGAGSLLFGGPAAGTTVGQSMAAIAQPAYYETAGAGILGNIVSAVPKTIGYLGEMAPAIGGLYSVIKPPEKAVIPTSRAPVPTVSAPAIAKSPLPIFSQSPQVMTVGGPAEKTAGPNYMIYIAIAALAFILLRKK